MKPRTQLEKDLQAAIDNGRLTPLNPKQMEQAHRIWRQDENKGYRLMLYTTTQHTNGMTLTKCYKAHQLGRGETFTMYQLCIVRAEREGETAWAARSCGIGVVDSFSHQGELSIKTERWWYKNYVDGCYPLQTKGKADPYAIVRHLCHNDYEFRDNRVETLSKIGMEKAIDRMMMSEKRMTDKLYNAIKIANRHHYDLNDNFYSWASMVEMLIFAGYDYRNPHYICPADFTQTRNMAIDAYDKKCRAIQEKRDLKAGIRTEADIQRDRAWRERYEQRQREIEAEEEELAKTYEKRLAKWLGIVITNGSIVIKPLQNIDEFKEEADAMEHCVYRNKYYAKKDTLILSAKDTKGNRLATIEYNLARNEIVQCRAYRNQHPKDYDTICALIEEAMAKKAVAA